MKTIVTALALAGAVASGPALAQMNKAPQLGTTRDAAIAAAATAFGRLDQNGDGSIDNAEVTAALQARATANGKTFRPKAAERMISRNDGNGDGKVTLDEFKTATGARFDQFDTNKNGTIDAGEASAAAPAGGGEE